MNNVKDLFENEELMDNIVEELEDFVDIAEVLYAVWALGYNGEGEATEVEYLIGEFKELNDAIACAEALTLEDFYAEYEGPLDTTDYLSIDIETVIAHPVDDDCESLNLGTVYHRELSLYDIVGFDGEPIIALTRSNYEIFEDNTIKIKAAAMKGFKKNDSFNMYFADDPDADILRLKVIGEEGNYYNCELDI
jgi:hypothetical protein